MSKAKKIILIVSVVLLLFTLFTFNVSAFETYYIDMPITQPTISDSLSYFEVSVRRSDGAIIGHTFLVSHKSMDNSTDIPVSVSLYEDGTRHIVKIYNHTDYPITASYVDSFGNVKNFESALTNGSAIEYRLSYPLTSVKSYGNIFVRDYKGFNTGSIVYQYGSTAKTNSLLTSILNALNSQSGSTGSIVGAIDESTNDIKQNQDENTQQIIDNQNNLFEEEKNEITQSGNQSSESVDEVPNQSEGFISALSGLTNAMSYNGTQCKWKLPNVYIPAISNIVPRINLISERDIDFGYWIEQIPSNVLSLIRAVSTLALIVFCFKELYNTISYVLTLKGGRE